MVLRLAWRYAFSKANKHRGVSIRIALGLGVGILAILATVSFMQALQRAQFDHIRTFESFDFHSDVSHSLEDGRLLAKELEGLGSVKKAFVYQDLPVLVVDRAGENHPMRIRAIDVGADLPIHPVAGELFSSEGVALSYRNRFLGNPLTITFLRSGKQVTQVPTQRSIPVSGIYATRYGPFDASTILATPEYLSSLTGGGAYSIGIFTGEESVREAERELGAYGFISYKEANRSLYQAMELEQKMMGLLLFLLIIVLIVHLHVSSKRLVGAKQREIALLRTLGFQEQKIARVFVSQGLIVAFIGCLLGLLLTALFILLYPLLRVHVLSGLGLDLTLALRFGEVALLCALILALAALGAYTGSRRLVHVDIMEILGHGELL
ncbi:MAG: ABC transporter permease [Spirochaetales bacterium]|nr:ABC transporter permease [Spirochaetales bacterium]